MSSDPHRDGDRQSRSDRELTDDAGPDSATDILRDADRTLERTYEAPMTLAEYVDLVLERPSIAAHAAKYLHDAIVAAGTRMVLEEGEELRRYRFFDDPYNDGEHAVLGNTAVLNDFVDDLRSIATGRGKEGTIIWFEGPTATGKSELKRCLVNGLREYSKTEAGRRYTIEWNVETASSETRGLSYGEEPTRTAEEHWYESPVQTSPLSVLPESVRASLEAVLEDRQEGTVPISLEADLDPFSREAYAFLEERYRRQETSGLFSAITDERHLRVKNYVVDRGQGIGILHAEDEGSPTERLVGTWMQGMLRELDSRGRKNPQAFSYDGVLAQGNGVLTVVEDASQHADLLRRLLNVPDESTVKLDKGIEMDLDTQLMVISNPDLGAQLDQHADRDGRDPLKALKRRLEKYEFRYLTNLGLEAELLRRELTGERAVRTDEPGHDRDEVIGEPATVTVTDEDGDALEREFAPHSIAAAALYAVVTRLEDDLPARFDLVDKAMCYERGYVTDGTERIPMAELDLEGPAGDGRHATTDGRHGMPVTYTRDVLANLVQRPADRHHPELPVESVVMPEDVLEALVNRLDSTPVFSPGERSEYAERVTAVRAEVLDRQETDVLEAALADRGVEAETVAEYVEQVYAWGTDEALEDDRGERIEPDPLRMKVFEVEHLGRFTSEDYVDHRPTATVEEFRHERIITAVNRHAWEHRDEDFSVESIDVASIDPVRDVLESHDWADLRRLYPDFEPSQWEDPPAETETAAVKAATIAAMVDAHGYSPASAELTSRRVMREVASRWD